ncbi:GABRB3 [Branchiostoma lanceolatum]|uniref:Gamma-aminobutyric acid receptor subunit pi n=1 Tax=Branchiostoma lanceolatum TaxID=7740 RepID=A0A8J9ZKT0_BRALA|nr:GABRB3 [Branchiostoma lanceolatum]
MSWESIIRWRESTIFILIFGVLQTCFSQGAPTLESLLVSRGYDRFLRPSFGGPPVQVDMSMTISSIDQISEVNMDYTITVFLRQYWRDERLAFAGSNHSLSLDGRLAEKLWVPDTFIPNAKESFLHKVTVDNKLIRLFPDGGILYGMRITAKAECNMDLKKYPMDSQNCTLGFESYGYKTEDIRFRWKAGNASIYGVESLQLQQFKIGSYDVINGMATYESGDYSNVKFCFLLHRQAFYFIFQTYIPSLLLVVLSWVGFWINAEAVPARVALGITTVLTMTTLIGGARATMPKISYIKAIDVYLITCFLFTFAALVEYAAVNFRSSIKKMKEAKRKMATEKKCRNKIRANMTGLHCVDEQENNHEMRHTILDIDMADDGTAGQGARMDGQRLRRTTSKKIGVTFANGVRHLVRSVSQVQMVRADVASIDRYSRWGFPLCFLLFNLSYFLHYTEPWQGWLT